ncbi:ISL3 family transposase [Rummeliibacillus sp. SL167]|uniref:ISL3 family transposase n=1 Tax=Rummeliibacillus sp. SL167 TaxID=2579792 RepID=UPI0011B6F6C0|nr:ISL3 family transposase [Rummeliibacillus sp. SL167]
MPFEYINELLNLPEVNIVNVEIEDDHAIIEVTPVDYVQNCPCCQSSSVIRNGIPYKRNIRHLAAFDKTVDLRIPAISLFCKTCHATFTWTYTFVEFKKRYTKAFSAFLARQTYGTTVEQISDEQQVPYSTMERIFKRELHEKSEQIQKQVYQEAVERDNLVLGIDDFAIRKGHTYNTGLHDLKGGRFLDVISGRKGDELRDYAEKHPLFKQLNPVAVVIDLAKMYHTFCAEWFPNAIRIADRFHVNRYVTEALQDVRRSVQTNLSSQAQKSLKAKARLLIKRADDLTKEEAVIVQECLSYDKRLENTYKWKEDFITWYDCAPDVKTATIWFERWCEQGQALSLVEVEECLKTMYNWKEEIINYHRLRYTNAAVEGRNNRIKALQRRLYFTRNQSVYKERIIVECNRDLA